MNTNELPITDEVNNFKNHLNQEGNNRIIFSGIFGIGKTYFINSFFKNNCDYISIKLNPVNYSVSPNQDIFELIKFDIAFQLISKNPDFQKINFSRWFSSQFFILENYKNIISNLIQNLSKIDQTLNLIVEPAVKLGKQIQNYQDEINKDDEKEIKEFLSFFKDQKGTIKEENNITELLTALIDSLRKNDEKIILVIDDLDRIDPEHIFRLLNVFSAHFDFQDLEGENKFGFDKVILICDIENIRGIFHNKYGAEIDFSGYIDKFYSEEIYYYKFENMIKDNLHTFISTIKTNNGLVNHQIRSSDSYLKKELQFLLSHFIDSSAISLRSILAFLKQDVIIYDYTLNSTKLGGGRVHSTFTPILVILEILEKLFVNKINFTRAIDKVINRFPLVQIDSYENYASLSIGNLAMLSDYTKNNLLISENSDLYNYDFLNLRIEYKIQWNNHSDGIVGYASNVSSLPLEIDIKTTTNQRYILPYFKLFKNAYIAKNEIVKKYY